LAYGFIRGKMYAQLEAKCYHPPNWKRVKEIAEKFSGQKNLAYRIEQWGEKAGPALDRAA
jgi:hypothetical protein